MKESIGSTFVVKIVIFLTLFFVAFISVAISYNKVFKIKNELLSIVEKYEGVNSSSINIIKNYMEQSSYNTYNYCPDRYFAPGSVAYGLSSYTGNFEVASQNKKYLICYKETNDTNFNNYGSKKNVKQFSVELSLFYKFNLPIIGDLLIFDISGQTKNIVRK